MLKKAAQWLGEGLAVIGILALLWPTLVVVWLCCLFICRVLNRMVVSGLGTPRLGHGVQVVSNHQSLIDSFFIGLAIYYPELLWQPLRAPYHLADARNYMTHPLLRYVYWILRVISVQRAADGTRRDSEAFRRAIKILKRNGMLHVFIEGTRSLDSTLLPPRPQVATIALLSGATIKPVYISGMHAVHPYRKRAGDPPVTWWRRLFGAQTEWLLDIRTGHTVHVVIGEDLTPDQVKVLAGEGDLRERSERLAQALMEKLKALKETLNETQRAQAA